METQYIEHIINGCVLKTVSEITPEQRQIVTDATKAFIYLACPYPQDRLKYVSMYESQLRKLERYTYISLSADDNNVNIKSKK